MCIQLLLIQFWKITKPQKMKLNIIKQEKEKDKKITW